MRAEGRALDLEAAARSAEEVAGRLGVTASWRGVGQVGLGGEASRATYHLS